VTLHFKDGRVERWEAGRGVEFLESILDRDAGARRLGEFAIGTNEGVDRFTRNVLYDEKMAGTIHCALGQTYAQTGGTNQSSVHWDMVTDMRAGRITADGELFYENGRFVI
jgi:aminopeptidase